MSKEDTKKAMSEAAKDAAVKRLLVTTGLGEKELKALKEKYGERAYDLIKAAMYPDNVRKALGWKTFKKSSATIKSFITNPLSAEQIDIVTGKKAAPKTKEQAAEKREDTKQTMKKQRKVAEEKETAAKAADKKKETAPKQSRETKSKSQTQTAAIQDKSTTQVSDTLRCQIEQHNVNGQVRFKSSVTDKQGVTIPELWGTTQDSMWEGVYRREVGSQTNPVGAYGRDKGGEYWGAMQYNQYGINNVALYALTKPEHQDYAKRFFNPGYEQALAAFQKYAKEKGNNAAYWIPNKYRSALLKYIKPEYTISGKNAQDLVRKEGKTNPTKFLQIQRDFATEVYTSQHEVYDRIVKALAKKNIKPEEVNPAIWELVLTSGIHYKKKLGAIASLFERPNINLTYINSAKMIDDIARADKSTFGGSGKKAIAHAKDTVHLKHSATTSRELAIILHKPEILANYEQLMAQNVTKVNGKYIAKANTPTKTAASNVRANNTARM